jgi:uncharacterized membrane protein YGL010W
MYLQVYLLLFFLGYNFDVLVQQKFGMRRLRDGVLYYAEVHTKPVNAIVHTLFMPVTVFGFYILLPSMFGLSSPDAVVMRECIMSTYYGLYAKISIKTTIDSMFIYGVVMCLADVVYGYVSLKKTVGFSIAAASLLTQEVAGHYMSGDKPSRVEAIPNAILYAIFFSVEKIRSMV